MAVLKVIRQPFLLPAVASASFEDDEQNSYGPSPVSVVRSTFVLLDLGFDVDFSNTARHITTATFQYSLNSGTNWFDIPSGSGGNGTRTVTPGASLGVYQEIVPPIWDADFWVRVKATDVFGREYLTNHVVVQVDYSHFNKVHTIAVSGEVDSNLSPTGTTTEGGRIIQATYTSKSFVYLRPENDGANLLGAGFATARVFYSTNSGSSWVETTRDVLESGQTLKVPIPSFGSAVLFYVTDVSNRYRTRPISVTAGSPNSGAVPVYLTDNFSDKVSEAVNVLESIDLFVIDDMDSALSTPPAGV